MDSLTQLESLLSQALERLAEVRAESADRGLRAGLELGTAVRDARKAQRLTQSELADLAGLSAGCVKRIESGRREVTLANVDKVLAVLGVKLWIQ